MDKKQQFLAAIKENEGFIYKLASAYTDKPQDRQDLLQEILYQLWKSFDSFNEKAKISTWMYRVALNVSMYHLKKSKEKIVTVPVNEDTEHYELSNDDKEEQWRILRQQVETLNMLDKGILILYLDDKTHEEIAEITGLSKTNVGTKLARIKNKLKQQSIKKYYYGT